MGKQEDDNWQKGLLLRKAKIPDLELLYEWRNHPNTRKASHNTNKITPSEHENWLQESFANPNRKIYIAEEDGSPVGTVRVDHCNDVFELSWTVAPESTGRGIGKQIVKEVADRIKGDIKAEVKVGNIASMRIAEYAGLSLDEEKDGVLFYSRISLE